MHGQQFHIGGADFEDEEDDAAYGDEEEDEGTNKSFSCGLIISE